MSIVTVDSIEDTQLCRQRELEDYDKAITYPRNDLLLDIHLLRSAAFVPSRSLAGSTDRFVCPQMPASRGLFVRQPHGPLQVRDALASWCRSCAATATTSGRRIAGSFSR